MSIWMQAYLTPSAQAVKFAIKTSLAMLLALYLALWFDLDRPYWALISAAFLQIRPMSGMVIEKGLCQIGGTFVGAVVGIAILGLFAQARIPALTTLTLWVMLCVYGSSLLRNNFSYGCIMGAVTAMLVVVIASSQPGNAFDIAVARLSEIGLGAICATLVSALLWPVRVKEHLAREADKAINQAFVHADQRLAATQDLEALQTSLTASLESLSLLEGDSQAARYEDPNGAGRIRATHVLTRRALRFLALLAALHQILQEHGDRIGSDIKALAGAIGKGFHEAKHVEGVTGARRKLQDLRRQAHGYKDASLDPLQRRLLFGLQEALGHALVMLDAREAIAHPGDKQLRAGALSWHRDRLSALLNAGRAGIVFACLATFWIQAHWSNGQVAMLMGTLFSAIFATRDNPVAMASMFFKGMVAAIPTAFLFGHVLLSQASGFPLFAMLVITPLFIGLLGAGEPRLMGYCLSFTIFNILLTMPSNGMDFSLDHFINRALAVIIGLSVVMMGFRLVPGLGATLRRRRLIHAISSDLQRIGQPSVQEAEANFSGHMVDRILQLAKHDDTLPEDQRHLFMLGLNGLDVGRVCLRLRYRFDNAPAPVQRAQREVVATLAQAYEDSANGKQPVGIAQAGQALKEAIEAHGDPRANRSELLEGLMERLALILERQAKVMAGQTSPEVKTRAGEAHA
ncbi:FUSC family protein [Pistricoccus aurantiacus]|uniref:FUSC family protein n=1 Tax=Pistricoccus aurantiacus TaxID=1883414 RepID=UPI003626C324